jgi:hypothetical protein
MFYLPFTGDNGSGGGGGGGTTIISGSVSTYADLPPAISYTGLYYIVDTNTGTWILGTLKKAGLYKSNGTTWVYIDNVPETTSLSDGTTVITGTNIVLEGGTEISTTTNTSANKITIASTGYTNSDLDKMFDLKQEVFVGICAKSPILPSDMVFDNTARTLTIATVNHNPITEENPICYYTDGNGISSKHEMFDPAIFNWTDTTGIWYLYFDVDGTAIASQTSWNDFGIIAPVARFYWNAILSVADKLQVYAYEAHQNTISADDHNWKHAQGTIWQYGLDLKHNAIASGAPNANGLNTCVGMTTGRNVDDNLGYTILNTTSPGDFCQDLGEITPANITTANGARFKVRSNDGAGRLTILPATRFPFPWNSGSNRPEYITTTGVRTLVSNNYFFVVYLYAFQDPRAGEPIKVVTSPTEYSTITLARASTWTELQASYPTLADNEIRPLYKLIYEYKSIHDIAVKYSALREVSDIRKAIVVATSSAGSIAASSVSFVPTGGISSTNVQSAIEELDIETVKLTGTQTIAGDKTFSGAMNITNYINVTSTCFAQAFRTTSITADWIAQLRNDAYGFKFRDVAGFNLVTISGDGKVGIGGISSVFGLDVLSNGIRATAPQFTSALVLENTTGVAGERSPNFTFKTRDGVSRVMRNTNNYFTITNQTGQERFALYDENLQFSGTGGLGVYGSSSTGYVESNIGFNILPVTNPNAPTGVVSAGGSVDTGAHWYGVTYVTALGETNITYSASQITTTAGNNTVTLTIPVSTDLRVTGRKIYRTKAGGGQFNEYLLATINDNTATSYVDTIADSSLTGSAGLAYFRINSTSKYITSQGTRACILDRNATSIGLNTLTNLTTGGRIAVGGYTAGAGITSATDIAAFGHNALGQGVCIGTSLSGFGAYSMRSATNAQGSSAFGAYSAFALTGGNYNTIVGAESTRTATMASRISALGYASAYTLNADGGVYLGYYAGRFETAGNKLFIDCIARADEADGRAKALIYGNFDSSVANQFLTVNGDLIHNGNKLGFYNTAPIVRQTVTGSRGGNIALASLLSSLASLGLIIDSTTS